MIHETSVVASGQKKQEVVLLKECFQRMIAEMVTKRALLGTNRNKICHNQTFPLLKLFYLETAGQLLEHSSLKNFEFIEYQYVIEYQKL